MASPGRPNQVGHDGFPGQFGDGDSQPLSLVAEAGIEVVRQLDGGPLHGMPAYHRGRRYDSS